MTSTTPSALAGLTWPLRTERLSIRPAQQGDAAAMFAYRTLPDVAQWLTIHPTDPVEWEAGFGSRQAETLVMERDGAVVGDLMVRVEDPWSQAEVRDQAVGTLAEIGYVLSPAHTGHGYATEAGRALLRLCFEGLGVRRVVAQCFAENTASWQLMERLGMRREQLSVRDCLHRDGQWRDGMLYAVLAEEWRAAQP